MNVVKTMVAGFCGLFLVVSLAATESSAAPKYPGDPGWGQAGTKYPGAGSGSGSGGNSSSSTDDSEGGSGNLCLECRSKCHDDYFKCLDDGRTNCVRDMCLKECNKRSDCPKAGAARD